MAARLEWKGTSLWLGPWILTKVVRYGPTWFNWVHPVGSSAGSYQNEEDAKQDAESEVRRLLKEAGVDCE